MRSLHARLRNSMTGTLARGTIAIACLLALAAWLPAARAASVYRCVDTHGRLAFQDTPCPAQTRQTQVAVAPQPLIGAPGEQRARAAAEQRPATRTRTRASRTKRGAARPAATSWECHAADGEVFYRHTRCPGSIAGDGVVREDYTERMARTYPRGRHNAWSRVRVHGTRIPRAEACRRIHSAGASVRDGHLRDANVSAYARMTGHDPCADP